MATSDTTSEGSERMAATPASAAVSGGEGAAAKALSLGEISGVHLGGPEPNVTIYIKNKAYVDCGNFFLLNHSYKNICLSLICFLDLDVINLLNGKNKNVFCGFKEQLLLLKCFFNLMWQSTQETCHF